MSRDCDFFDEMEGRSGKQKNERNIPPKQDKKRDRMKRICLMYITFLAFNLVLEAKRKRFSFKKI